MFEVKGIPLLVDDIDVLKELNEYIQELQYTIDDLQSEVVNCSGLIEDLYNDFLDQKEIIYSKKSSFRIDTTSSLTDFGIV